MFEPLYTAAEMRAAEERYPGYPDSMRQLMETAGRAVADETLRRYPDARSFTIVCGPGSNGGDGKVAARVLEAAGRDVVVVDSKPEDEEKRVGDPDVVVDALFGTGFFGDPRPGAARLIEQVNALARPVVSVDIASGVDASTGEVSGAAVRAALTVTFHGPKVGIVVAPGRFHAGDVVVADIGLESAETAHRLVGDEVLSLVPPKRSEDNKYSAGMVVVVGGSPGMTGAACLAAEAAFRADAGYVAVAVPASTLPVFEQRLLEAVKRPLPEDEAGLSTPAAAEPVLALAARAGSVALGPGLGRSDGTRELVARLLRELDVPVVVDADALFGLEPGDCRAPAVLTPHEGELARLLGEESRWVAAHRLEALGRAVERFRSVVLLKGPDTVIGAPGEPILVRSVDAPGLATAGTGDVLTGVLAAFLAKGLEPRLAAAAGATALGIAATLAPHARGMVASDVAAALPAALSAAQPRLQ